MTLILKLDLDMVKMYLHTKNEVSMLRGSKSIAWTDRQTDTHTQIHTQTDRHTDRQTDRQTDMTENITYPHTRVVTSVNQSFNVLYYCKQNKLCTSLGKTRLNHSEALVKYAARFKLLLHHLDTLVFWGLFDFFNFMWSQLYFRNKITRGSIFIINH